MPPRSVEEIVIEHMSELVCVCVYVCVCACVCTRCALQCVCVVGRIYWTMVEGEGAVMAGTARLVGTAMPKMEEPSTKW